VLKREYAEKRTIDDQCPPELRVGGRIHRLWNEQISDEADGIKEGCKGDCISDNAIPKYKNAFHVLGSFEGIRPSVAAVAPYSM
jgi:hypothetical protein